MNSHRLPGQQLLVSVLGELLEGLLILLVGLVLILGGLDLLNLLLRTLAN
jgi:hypothetical protein